MNGEGRMAKSISGRQQHNRRGVEMAEGEREEGLKRRERGECHFLALMPPFLSLWGGYLKDVHLEAQSEQAFQERLCVTLPTRRGGLVDIL